MDEIQQIVINREAGVTTADAASLPVTQRGECNPSCPTLHIPISNIFASRCPFAPSRNN